LGMNYDHLMKLKLKHVDFITMGWPLKEFVEKFKLNERQREHLGIDDSVINFVSSSTLSKPKKQRKSRRAK
jgi:hypothetical protein